MGGCAENSALVLFQDLEPGSDIGGMIRARLGGEAKIGREERRSKFGDKFLHRIAFIAKPLASEIPVKTARVPRPVRYLMGEGGIVGFSVAERLERGHLYPVPGGRVE